MAKGVKKPKATRLPQGDVRIPKALPVSTVDDRFVLSFEITDLMYDGSWGWSRLNDPRKLLAFLKSMSQLSWSEINAQLTGGRERHRRHHPMPKENLCAEAQGQLVALKLDDIEELFRFRLTGKARLWGLVSNAVFYALWWDPDHEVYPLEKD